MADIEFNCPNCQKPLAVDERGAGKFVNCPKCGGGLTVPTPHTPENSAETVTARPTCRFCGFVSSTPNPKFCVKCGKTFSLSRRAGDKDVVSDVDAGEASSGEPCAQCGKVPSPDATFCTGCGAPLTFGAEEACPKCNAVLEPSGKFCKKCGTELDRATQTSSPLRLQINAKPSLSDSGGNGSQKKCLYCGASLAWGAVICTSCGHDFRSGQTTKRKSESKSHGIISSLFTTIFQIFKAIAIIGIIIVVIGVAVEMMPKKESFNALLKPSTPPTAQPQASVPQQVSSAPIAAPTPPPETVEERTNKEVQKIAENILTEWRDGSIYSLHVESFCPQRIISPTEWTVRNVYVYGDGTAAHVTVFVKSSNRGGMPIQGNWLFFMHKEGGRWTLYSLSAPGDF